QTHDIDPAVFVHEEMEKSTELSLQSDYAEGRGIEFHLLFKVRVWGVIGSQDGQCAVGDAFQECVDVDLCTQWWIHFVIRIKTLNRLVGQRDVMWTNLAADLDAPPPCFAKQSHASGGGHVLAMDVMIAKLGKQDIAHDNHFLARRGPARQTEQRAPITFIHDTDAD